MLNYCIDKELNSCKDDEVADYIRDLQTSSKEMLEKFINANNYYIKRYGKRIF